MESKTIYELELHESTTDNSEYTVTRVEGGWIYRRQVNPIPVFVPYDNEFEDVPVEDDAETDHYQKLRHTDQNIIDARRAGKSEGFNKGFLTAIIVDVIAVLILYGFSHWHKKTEQTSYIEVESASTVDTFPSRGWTLSNPPQSLVWAISGNSILFRSNLTLFYSLPESLLFDGQDLSVVTIPPDDIVQFPRGKKFKLYRIGQGLISVSPAPNVTLDYYDDFTIYVTDSASIEKIQANHWKLTTLK